jgi:hypothetical protein
VPISLEKSAVGIISTKKPIAKNHKFMRVVFYAFFSGFLFVELPIFPASAKSLAFSLPRLVKPKFRQKDKIVLIQPLSPYFYRLLGSFVSS